MRDYKDSKNRTFCAFEGCEESIPNHYWGKIKADNWFSQKDGTIWCPEHIPDWVPAWREARRRKV